MYYDSALRKSRKQICVVCDGQNTDNKTLSATEQRHQHHELVLSTILMSTAMFSSTAAHLAEVHCMKPSQVFLMYNSNGDFRFVFMPLKVNPCLDDEAVWQGWLASSLLGVILPSWLVTGGWVHALSSGGARDQQDTPVSRLLQ